MEPLEPLLLNLTLSYFTDNLALNIGLLILLVLLLMASAFFSSTETAYSSANIIRLRNYMEEKKKGAKKAVYIAEKFDITLTTILIGNNFVNIAATTIGAFILGKMIVNPTIANVVNTIVMTVIVLIFGEILPKTHGKANSEKVALRAASTMYFIIKLLWPISYLFLKLNEKVKAKRGSKTNPYVTEEELESIIDVMETEGIINEEDAELIQSAIGLSDRSVFDIMTPRVDVIAVDINDSIDSIKELFFTYQFSRMPVYHEDKDHIVGVLSERDFFTALLKNEAIDLPKMISEPYFVSKKMKVNDLIKEMQKLKKHFAIVADEYGGTSGIVTMEDALEELVGEIYDEYDDEDDLVISQVGDKHYLLSANMDLEELFESLKLGPIPPSNYTTVGGFVYELCEDLPIEGKSIHYPSVYEEFDLENPVEIKYDLEFIVKKVENRRIRNVELKITEISE
ncbi:MAG TPA: hemolysin family protein [Bacilli bacterium]|nr:MAG: Magnesium and cobalt efflux protein CorC [Tenericutes bacterium ADurb.BinA124]HNZ49942.1 hemolysin family protein [Bacilli bacterium]HPN60576.1 hemolysin family protein [Bacilli bacterium]HPX83723.1 hemolysin family protein [Bacilli bacterium]HQC74583.1 hemolysin family protein [Bacilli bacterium]